ncbi:hypothetical protein AB0L82_24990 [Nocardia sp. NPDC052001]|uniref:hypothetical protein n=1 Tax=Nocardia sp. NPDC052001 TaxID=3154853 RepID=UPI003438FBD7
MGEVPDARAELDRLGNSLRTQLLDLITLLTPGADPTLLFLDEPTPVDDEDPAAHHYSTTFRGQRPNSITAADTIRQAATLLANSGWEVSESREVNRTLITAYRSGCTLELRIPDHTPTVLYSATTPAFPLPE